MTAPNNPPAFPLNAGEFGIEPSPGMSLRDYFAGQALAGMCAHSGSYGFHNGPGEYAKRSYEIADAMLKERAKG